MTHAACWIALRWPDEALAQASPQALAWWALRLTPHVLWLDEALLLEVSSCLQLWGGLQGILARLQASNPAPLAFALAQGDNSLLALARLRLLQSGRPLPATPAAMPMWTLSAARPHLPVLQRLGCHAWGQLDALPRAGLAQRFGPQLLRALDQALGRGPDTHAWLQAPERFCQQVELPQRVLRAPALLWAARRLLGQLQQWLLARQLGVLALELAWTFDQLRLDGRELPPRQTLRLRTAQPVQAMDHLQRLLRERLDRTIMLAPAASLGLRVLQTAPQRLASAGLLPQDRSPSGEPLHVVLERVVARLGTGSVQTATPRADYRLECRAAWQPWTPAAGAVPAPGAESEGDADGWLPAWLWQPARALRVGAGLPLWQGRPLQLLAGPRRIESAWWPVAQESGQAQQPAARDYYIARSACWQLLLVYCQRRTSESAGQQGPQWFAQGAYA